jgi:hypothetical protein
MAMTLKEFKKSSFRTARYFNEIKTEADLEGFRNEIRELTNNGNYECVYELAQMDSLDPDDIINLIS